MLSHTWQRLTLLALLFALALGAGIAAAQTPRGITRVHPPVGAREMDTGTLVAIDFSQAMERASTAAALSIVPAVDGQIVWSDDGRRLELRPREPLPPQSSFDVTLASTARDARGQPVLTGDFRWSFTTGVATDQMRFSYSVPVQLVTPAGGRGVPIQPGVPRLTLDLALYEVDLTQFASRYAKLRPYEDNVIAFDGLAKRAEWRHWVDAAAGMAAIPLPKGTAPGLYLLDARHPTAGEAQTFVIFSDYALVAKEDLGGKTLWASRLFSGAPAGGVRLALVDAAGQELAGASATADADGIARFDGGEGAAFAVMQVDDQLATLVGLDAHWSNEGYRWGWWDRGPWQPQLPAFAGHVHTDRPIYRPGHTVHYKATLRRHTADGYRLLEPTVPVTVTIHDTQGNTVLTAQPTLDEFGSLAGELPLGDDVGLGSWYIRVDAASRQTFHGYFEVQAYAKPDFEVTVASEEPYYVQGDTARVNVSSRYYFGQPTAGADATLRLYRGYYSPDNQPTLQVTGILDDNGKWSTEVRLPDDGGGYTQHWYLEAEVVDKSRRPVVAQGGFPVHPADFVLSLTNERYGVESGQPVRMTASTVDHDGRPVAGRQVAVAVQQYRSNGQVVIRSLDVTTGADGLAPFTLAGLSDGWYSVQATARDDRGHAVTAYSYAWIYDTLRPWYWWGGLEVAADRDSYAPGDTARLLIKSPITTTALVTLERDKVYEELLVPVSGATAVEVPILASYAPNVLARVHLWQPSTYEGNRGEGQLVMAEVNLTVPATEKLLDVEVLADRDTYEPGDAATFTIRVKDHAGQAVKAQVSLAVVDKAVLALAGDRNGAVFDAFWSSRWQRAQTYNSLQPSNWYGYQEDLGGGRGGQPPGAPGTATPAPAASPEPQDEASQAQPRREFPDTAYWRPDLVTSDDGTVRVVVKLPDTLTTWQALARAITVDTAAGQGKHEVVVTKAIIADPALPRFAVQGDAFALDILARNYTGPGVLDATVSLDTPGLVQLDAGDKALSLPFNATEFARWSVVASKLGTQPVTARVSTAAGADAIELPLDVAPFTAPDRFVRAGGVTDVAAESFEVPYNAEPSSSRVELRLAPAMAVSILDGLESLIDYPYGCVEQTMSRVLPNAVVGRLVLALDIQAPEITARLPEMMKLGLQKLYGFQNGDGGWGWWRGEGNLYTTAYVLHGLTLTQAAGFEVDAGVLDRGFGWLASNLDAEADVRLRTYALYVLAEAGRGDAARTAALYTSREKLDSFSLAALAVALHRVGRDDLAGPAVDLLVSRVNETPTTASWPLPPLPPRRWWYEDAYYWRSMASTENNSAMALEALSLLRPTSPLAPKAARWLLENRYGHGWSSTQATAYAVLALTDYIHASGELRSEYDWAVRLDGAVVAEGRVDVTNVTQRIPPLALRGDQLTPGKHELVLEKRGQGTLFYTALGRMSLYYDGFAPTAASGIGLTVDRAYTLVDQTGAASQFHAGDVVNVRLTLTTQEDLWYVMIEDMLPAGLEGLNEGLDTETKRPPGQDPWSRWRWWGYERKEMHDDKVVFFATRLPAGSHTFDYAARALTPGTFSARPAEASTMYRPEIWARSASAQIAVDPQRVKPRPILAGDFDRDCRLTGFDTQLVAADWAAAKGRDLTGDTRVTVGDVALANGRVGAACGDGVANPPGNAGAMDLRLRTVGEVRQGEEFVLEVVAAGGTNLADGVGNVGGFEATLRLPVDALQVVGLAAGPTLAGARLLGPVAGTDEVRLGGYLLRGVDIGGGAGGGTGGETVLARLTLKALQADAVDITVREAQIVTDRGGEYTVTADGVVVSPVPWRAVGVIHLPLAGKP